jgi:hypothetical protein
MYAKHKSISTFVLSVMIMAQVLFVGNVLLMPKPAQAFSGLVIQLLFFGMPMTQQRRLHCSAKTIALRFVDGFLTRFMDKVVEKYKIRNFVYYDQVLSDYYLVNYIHDKVSDPDLRNIFCLLDSTYVAGNNTGYSGYNPNNAIIPQLKRKINELYLAKGVSQLTQFIIRHPICQTQVILVLLKMILIILPGNTENRLMAQFGNSQAATSTAAQLEQYNGWRL